MRRGDELTEMRATLADAVMVRAELRRDMKEAMKEYKEALQPIEGEIAMTCDGLRNKAHTVKEECYVLADYDAGVARYYNAAGAVVYERPLEVHERQGNLPGVIKLAAQA
jgi:hypothetical protein